MKKQIITWNGKKYYLLGTDVDGTKYWLEESKFDCNWYWGIGYVETFTNNRNPERSRDIQSHQHFDGLFFDKKENGRDIFEQFIIDSTLSDKEVWQLMEIMQTLYMCRNYSDMLYCGGSHYTTNPCSAIIKNQDEYERINKIVIPKLLEELYKLLGEEN